MAVTRSLSSSGSELKIVPLFLAFGAFWSDLSYFSSGGFVKSVETRDEEAKLFAKI